MAPKRSPHFDAVTANLQLGGTVYAYVDIDGDPERVASFLISGLRASSESLAGSAVPLDAAGLVRALGLDGIRAIGLSSYDDGDRFHNRSFVLYQPGPRRGLLEAFGGAPKAFELKSVAPEGSDLVWEQQLDIEALVDAARALGERGIGPSAQRLDAMLDQRPLGLDLTFRQILARLETTAGLVIEIDESRRVRVPGSKITFPAFEFLMQIDGLGPLADSIAGRADFDPFIRAERSDQWLIVGAAIRLPPPWNAFDPRLIKDLETDRLYLVSSPNFFRRCLDGGSSVDDASEFAEAFEGLPPEGNAMLYLSPAMTRSIHGLLDWNIAERGESTRTVVSRALLPDAGASVGWVGMDTGNGLLFTSNTPSSHKSTLVALGYAALLPAIWAMGSSDVTDVPPPLEVP